MQTQQSPPHISHHQPWAHDFICCDLPHNASTSLPTGHSMSHNYHSHSHPPQSSALTTPNPDTNSPCAMEIYCSADEYCDGLDCSHGHSHVSECCPDPECDGPLTGNCTGRKGDTSLFTDMSHIGHHHDSGDDCGHDHDGMTELERWACSKEGCHAIQQYLECCAQTDCNIPICHNPPAHTHPPNDPFGPGFGTGQMTHNPWQMSDLVHGGSATPSLSLPTHVCHWQNCHQVFHSMPDLLAHVASDHLGAPGFPSQSAIVPNQQVQQVMPTAPPLLNYSAPGIMQFNNQPIQNTIINTELGTMTPQQQQESDHLLSCLWDDCFPPDSATTMAYNQNIQQAAQVVHQDMPAHNHAHSHPSGEPFSPSTMLRHVLEEHLGVPGDIIGWGPDTPNLALGPLKAVKDTPTAAHHHHHHHHHHLPTPASSTSSHHHGSPSPSSGSTKSLVCLWPGCTHAEAFPSAALLMDHLATDHIGKGKEQYVCLWDGCGGPGGRLFKSRQKVLRHLQSHTGHRPYVCGECGQAFSEAAPLAAHLRRHAQDKPFACEHPGCGKKFAISSSLTIHMRTHNGEKPFVCPHCNKGFVEASNLTKHIRTHTGEKPFVCSFAGCNKRFPRPDQLKRHMAIHDADRPGRKTKVQHNKAEIAVSG